MTEIPGGCTNIDMVGGYVNHSAKREGIYFLRKMCGSMMEGLRERLLFRNIKWG